MTPLRPMLGDLELQQVQEIETDGEQIQTRHEVPALEGDFLQGLGRRGTRIDVAGVLTGPESRDSLKTLREKFRAAEPVSFVSDVASATRIEDVLIEDLAAREIAGQPERLAYALKLREFTEPPSVTEEDPPVIPPPPPPPVEEEGTLSVEVTIDGSSEFDFESVVVSTRGETPEGEVVSRTLSERTGNVWTEERLPAGGYNGEATTKEAPVRAAAGAAEIRAGETTEVQLALSSPQAAVTKIFIVHFRFDKAFIEPCMRPVLKQVADRAKAQKGKEKLVVVGHTDKAGPGSYNQSLSERRARATYAYLTSASKHEGFEASVAEWQALRVTRPAGEQPSLKDSWGAHQYQYMLQDLGFYSGNVDGKHKELTDDAVRAFRCEKGLPPGNQVDDPVWEALIRDYLAEEPLAVEKESFLPNCGDEILKWLGCGEQDPLTTSNCGHRPSRRAELMFVTVNELPCKVHVPDTFEKPEPGAVAEEWCLGEGDKNQRCCFVVPALAKDPNDAKHEGKLQRPAPVPTIDVEGRITLEDGTTPFAKKRFVLIAPDGTYRKSESCDGKGQPDRTDADGRFSYSGLPVGVYTLEVREKAVARLLKRPGDPFKGNVVCRELTETDRRLDVVVQETQLREIVLPAVAHLMKALVPDRDAVRTCPDPGDPNLRHPQATRHSAADVQRFFREANGVLAQARVRLEPVEIVEEVFSTRPECQITVDEFGLLLSHCAHPNAVNVFFVGDLEGATRAGLYGIATVGGARGFVDGCAVGDRFETALLGIPELREADEAQTVQVLANAVASYLGVEEIENTPGNAGRLMLPETLDGSNRTLIDDEVEQARKSCNAALDCATLELEVSGATRIGSSPEHVVVVSPGGTVAVEASVPAPLVEPGIGTLTLEPHDADSPTRLTVATGSADVTVIIASYSPATGGVSPSCLPPTVGAPGAPVSRTMRTWAVVRVVSFPPLTVEGTDGATTGTTLVTSSHATAVVTARAEVSPAPFCVPPDLLSWSGGAEHLDPLRRTVPRNLVAAVPVQATLAGTTRSVTIRVVQVAFVSDGAPAGGTVGTVQIEGILNGALSDVHRGRLFDSQPDSLFRIRADVPGVPAAHGALDAALTSIAADGSSIETINVELERTQPGADSFLSLPILAISQAITAAEATLRTPRDLEVIRAQAGGRIELEVNADVPLGAPGRSQVTVRGNVVNLFAVAFAGSNTSAADILDRIEKASRVWAQAGIEVKPSAVPNSVRASIPAPPGVLSLDHTDDTGQNLTQDELRLVGRAAPSLPSSGVATDLNIYYVREIVELGNPPPQHQVGGIAFPNDPVIAIDASRDKDFTLAHEIGHQILINWGGSQHQDRGAPPRDWPRRNIMHPQDAGGSDLDRDQAAHLLLLQRVGLRRFVLLEP